MKRTFVYIVGFILIMSCNDSEVKEKLEKESYQVTKKSLEETEKKDPVSFLAVEGYDKKNILGQTVIKGTVTNKATVASYKDIDLKLDFYSKTGALLETDKETVYELINPGQSKNFKTKYCSKRYRQRGFAYFRSKDSIETI